MLSWANRFNICCFLDNHGYHHTSQRYECLLAADAVHVYTPAQQALNGLAAFLQQHKDWLFGHFSYELKNDITGQPSQYTDAAGFPAIFLFQPATVIALDTHTATIETLGIEPGTVFADISWQQPAAAGAPAVTPAFTPRISKEIYLESIKALQQHILRGDCYEINFCQEFYTEAVIDPLATYLKLTTLSPTPFAAYYKVQDAMLLCASPERFLYKQGQEIISQPIKGTSKRDLQDARHDEQLKQALYHSSKDRSENVMVVDLVRNDLSRICEEGSVEVEELFGVYSFPQVHQLISTVRGRLKKSTPFDSILRACFPMGSMTGAPKKRVMELIDRYEQSRRGIYSGAVGYISPDNDFDFNVVIRSLLYNAQTHYLGYQVGGGITFYSDPQKEYEECLLKAAAIKKALQ